jgi:signal peptidase I
MPRRIAAAGLVLAMLTGCAAMPVRLYYAPSGSMLPTIPVGAKILVNKAAYAFDTAPERQDIVVFTPPIPASGPFIKRVIAIPGDRFKIEGGKVAQRARAARGVFPAAGNVFDVDSELQDLCEPNFRARGAA